MSGESGASAAAVPRPAGGSGSAGAAAVPPPAGRAAHGTVAAAAEDAYVRQELRAAMKELRTLRKERDWLLDRLVQYDALLLADSDIVADEAAPPPPPPLAGATTDRAASATASASAVTLAASKRKYVADAMAVASELQRSHKKTKSDTAGLPPPPATPLRGNGGGTHSSTSSQSGRESAVTNAAMYGADTPPPRSISSLPAFSSMSTPVPRAESASLALAAIETDDNVGSNEDSPERKDDASASSAHVTAAQQQSAASHKQSRKAPENRVRHVKTLAFAPDGTATVPAKYGPVKLLSLGAIESIDTTYHTDRYIYPVGYKVLRNYLSTTDASNDSEEYVCQILRGESAPRFEVYATANPSLVWSGKSSSGAWAAAINLAYAVRNRQPTNAVCGPDLFALTSAEIAKAIQELPGAEKCARYKWQTFLVTDGDGAAAVLERSTTAK